MRLTVLNSKPSEFVDLSFCNWIFLRSSHLLRFHLCRKEVKNESLTYSRTVVGGVIE